MSFAQEMKDFLAGWQAVSDTVGKGQERQADREYREAMAEISRGELAIKQEELKLRERAQALRERTGGGSATPKPSEVRAEQRFQWEKEDRERAAAEREAEKAADSIPDEAVEEYGDEDLYTPAYAEGGAVEEAIETSPRPKPRPAATTAATPAAPTPAPNTPLPPERPAAIPTDAASPAPAPKPEKPAAAAPVNQEATKIILKPAEDALGQVGETFITELGKSPTATEGAPDVRLPLQDFDAILKTIDPEGKLPPHLETAAALGAAFQVVKDPAKKYKLAVGVLGSAMEQSQILGSLVPDALRAGNVNEACRLFNDACNKFPTGHQVEVTPIAQGFSYQVRDVEGQVVMDGKLTPEQMLEMSGKVADGSLFIQNVYQFQQRNKDTKGSPDRALQNVETAAGRVAGIKEALAMTEEGTPEHKKLVEEQKNAMAALEKARSQAAGLKVKTTDIRAAQKAGMDMAIPYEAPAAPADDRGFFEKILPEALGGKPAPTAAVPTAPAVPASPAAPAAPAATAAPAAPVTPKGNNEILPVPPQDQRVVGQTYRAPNGKIAIWRGTGWELVK